MVVSAPCPGNTIVVSGNGNNRSSIDEMIVSNDPPGNLVAPGPPGNNVSPVKSNGVSSTWNEIDPGV